MSDDKVIVGCHAVTRCTHKENNEIKHTNMRAEGFHTEVSHRCEITYDCVLQSQQHPAAAAAAVSPFMLKPDHSLYTKTVMRAGWVLAVPSAT